MSAPNSIQTTKPQKSTPLDNVKQNQQEPHKFHYNFVYKATIVLIFFVILPLFPSQAPEFISQNLLTRNWELLHLLFVGIAISYGLFSRRNQEPDKDKDNNSKFDNTQSLVSRFLQVSSFFEDETDHQNQSESDDITKIQTWSNQNQHYRNKPMVVVAPQLQIQPKHSVFEEQSGFDEIEKPLLLPVRSLKSRLSDDDADVVQSQSVDGSLKKGSKRFSRNSFNRVGNYAEFEGVVEQKEKENDVLPSPIPWRSRSASARMMEPKQEAIEKASKASVVMELKQEANEKASKSSMVKASSIKSTPSESVAKNAEDLMKKKRFCFKTCPPPPPPPPPPPTMFYKPISMKTRYGEKNGRNMSMEKSLEEGTNEKEDEDEDKEYSASSMQELAEKERFIEKRVILEAEDEETESEEDEDVGELKQSGESFSKTEEPCSSSLGGSIDTVSDEGPDVDKKADEFIAKFREQIRLQRIESIKRSTRVARNSSR